MLVLLIATALILVAALAAALRIPPRGGVAFVLATALLAQAMIVVTVGFAGLVLRSLAPVTLLVLAVAWPVAVLGAARLTHRPPTRWRARLGAGVRELRSALSDPAVAIAAVLVVGALAWRLLLILRLPVVDYDGWSYHLVFVDVWLQHDALVLVPHRPWTAGYPAATEMLTTWLMAFERADTWAGLTSLLPIPLAIAGVTGLARTLGADKRRALLAGLLFAMTPALVALAGTTYVDAASVGTVVATWWLGLRVVRGERDPAAALLLGIAGGLALGTKGTNAMLIGPVLAAAFLVVARDLVAGRGRPAIAARRIVSSLALLVVPILVLGASWYLKNALVYGNPLYPFAVGPFDGPSSLTAFTFTPAALDGQPKIEQIVRSWITDWSRTWYAFNVRPGGFGRAWPLILVVAIAGGVLLLRRRRWAAVALVVAPAVLTLLTMPMPWYARLTLFVLGVAVPLAAVALTALPARAATVAALVLVAVATISLAWANIRPNIDIRAAFDDQRNWPGVRKYMGYLADPDEERRMAVALRGACAGFDVIPTGEVVVPGGFNLMHGIVGPGLERILGDPLEVPLEADDVHAEMRRIDASWLTTTAGTELDLAVAAAPQLFEPYGEICRGGKLWQARPVG